MYLIVFVILITCLLNNVLILQGDIIILITQTLIEPPLLVLWLRQLLTELMVGPDGAGVQ